MTFFLVELELRFEFSALLSFVVMLSDFKRQFLLHKLLERREPEHQCVVRVTEKYRSSCQNETCNALLSQHVSHPSHFHCRGMEGRVLSGKEQDGIWE